jgi:hypothetical protein
MKGRKVKMINIAENIIEDFNEREELIARIDVLDKVGNILLLPKTEMATIKQVAEYYQVHQSVVEMVLRNHSDELLSDGVGYYKKNDVLNLLNQNDFRLKTYRGKTEIIMDNGTSLMVASRGLRIFPKRAILRVGMLLRDSEIAKEIRTQLLNVVEKTSKEVLMEDKYTEAELYNKLAAAIMSGDTLAYGRYSTEIMNFKNRHIKKLEEANADLSVENKVLAKEN